MTAATRPVEHGPLVRMDLPDAVLADSTEYRRLPLNANKWCDKHDVVRFYDQGVGFLNSCYGRHQCVCDRPHRTVAPTFIKLPHASALSISRMSVISHALNIPCGMATHRAGTRSRWMPGAGR